MMQQYIWKFDIEGSYNACNTVTGFGATVDEARAMVLTSLRNGPDWYHNLSGPWTEFHSYRKPPLEVMVMVQDFKGTLAEFLRKREPSICTPLLPIITSSLDG